MCSLGVATNRVSIQERFGGITEFERISIATIDMLTICVAGGVGAELLVGNTRELPRQDHDMTERQT